MSESLKQLTNGDPMREDLVTTLFYAYDGALLGEDPTEVQALLVLFTSMFARVGLKMNADKTECMIMDGGRITQPMPLRAHKRKLKQLQ
jgi:hypothetical protein